MDYTHSHSLPWIIGGLGALTAVLFVAFALLVFRKPRHLREDTAEDERPADTPRDEKPS